MEFLLLLIAAGIIFYLVKSFNIYLSNPISPADMKQNTQQQPQEIYIQEPILTPKERLQRTEYGILVRILGRLSYADKKSCILEEKLVNGIIEDMAKDSLQPKSLFMELYRESEGADIEELATLLRDETIGQYKKRVKIIEFMFALAYADGHFSKEEEDCIISVAAILEIENDDFNNLYDEFQAVNKEAIGKIADSNGTIDKVMDTAKALSLLALKPGFTPMDLATKFDEVFQEKQHHVLDYKNLGRSYNQTSAKELRELSAAYEHLSSKEVQEELRQRELKQKELEKEVEKPIENSDKKE